MLEPALILVVVVIAFGISQLMLSRRRHRTEDHNYIAEIRRSGVRFELLPHGVFIPLSFRRKVRFSRDQIVSLDVVTGGDGLPSRGIRLLGTSLPKGLKAGLFYGDRARSFWLIDGAQVPLLLVELQDHFYRFLVIQVEVSVAQGVKSEANMSE